MNLYLRLIRIIFQSILGFRRGNVINFPDDASVLWFRAWPTDCDVNGHLTHSRYASLSDLGRVDWAIRIGVGRLVRERKWAPMVAAMHLEYRREIKPFERFSMETKVLGWDGSNILVEHQYFVTRDGEKLRAARALARVGFYQRSEKRFVQVAEINELLGYSGDSPDLGKPEQQFLATRLTKGKSERKLVLEQ